MVPHRSRQKSSRPLLSDEPKGGNRCDNLQQWRTAKTRAAWVRHWVGDHGGRPPLDPDEIVFDGVFRSRCFDVADLGLAGVEK